MLRTRCLILIAIAAALGGCATKLDPRDPEIFRPVKPQYVEPK